MSFKDDYLVEGMAWPRDPRLYTIQQPRSTDPEDEPFFGFPDAVPEDFELPIFVI